jgi:DNA polymerase-3 subunit delta
MIVLLMGNNSFAIERERCQLEADFSGDTEKVDGTTLELRQLPDLLMGMTLFAEKRLVIIRDLSDNSPVWSALGEWVEKVSSDISLVLIEIKPDKRTKTYKTLLQHATVKYCSTWTERDSRTATQWAITEAKQRGFTLDSKSADIIVRRSMVPSLKPGGAAIDQWRIDQALTKLSVLETVNPEITEDIIEPSPIENVFDLFDAALRGNAQKVREMLLNLELSEDPYRLFGLLSGQVFQLAALSVSDTSSDQVAKDISAHPYALGKLAAHANSRGRSGAKKIVAAFAEADIGMKTSLAEPWLLIERALLKVATTK